MARKNPSVDGYLRKAARWGDEMALLREIVLATGLEEEVKWRQPCYTMDGRNIVIIGAFKNYCSLSFFKGVLLADEVGLLEAPGENTQSGRLIRFTSVERIAELKPAIEAYVREAIQIEKDGRKPELKARSELVYPSELQAKLDGDPMLRAAFEGLTPGRRRSHVLHIAAAKRSETRASRVDRCVPEILAGKGFNEDYLKKRPR